MSYQEDIKKYSNQVARFAKIMGDKLANDEVLKYFLDEYVEFGYPFNYLLQPSNGDVFEYEKNEIGDNIKDDARLKSVAEFLSALPERVMSLARAEITNIISENKSNNIEEFILNSEDRKLKVNIRSGYPKITSLTTEVLDDYCQAAALIDLLELLVGAQNLHKIKPSDSPRGVENKALISEKMERRI